MYVLFMYVLFMLFYPDVGIGFQLETLSDIPSSPRTTFTYAGYVLTYVCYFVCMYSMYVCMTVEFTMYLCYVYVFMNAFTG